MLTLGACAHEVKEAPREQRFREADRDDDAKHARAIRRSLD
jgi:hypothetical protein